MKNKTTIKAQLGLTQEEMAMLLKITESQWSMFKSGKRSLSLEATKQLSELLQHIKNKKNVSEECLNYTTAEQIKTQQQLQQNYLKVQIKQHLIVQKIIAIENKRTECFAALEIASFIENQKNQSFLDHLAQTIRIRATKTLKQNNLYQLTTLQLQKESLEVLKNSLAQKLRD